MNLAVAIAPAAALADRGVALLAAGRPEAALVALAQAVDDGEDSKLVWLNLALAEAACGAHERARARLRRLLDICPDWDEPALHLAENLRQAGHEDAEAAYRALLARHPARLEGLIGLAMLLLARDQPAEAQSLLMRACSLAPGHAEAWDALGLVLQHGTERDAAQAAFARASLLAPGRWDFALHAAEAAVAAGGAQAELARLDAQTSPLNAASYLARGLLWESLGKRDAAIDALEVAATLAPDAAQPMLHLGGLLVRSARLREAEAALRRAMEIDPVHFQTRADLAAALMRMHRHAEAETLLLGLLAERPDEVVVLSNFATVQAALGQQDQAVATARRAAELAPDSTLPWRTLCNVMPYQAAVDARQLLAQGRRCSAVLARKPAAALENIPDPDRKLRIGLLSGSLRTHPVGWLTIAGFETLDPRGFSLVGLGPLVPSDPMARRYRAVASDWIGTDLLHDEELAAAIRAAGIDILIDLGGYGEAGRMPVCAHRAAPVQIKWVGMQNHSSGLAEMDWFLTDRWETPPGFEAFYSEKLLRLPDGYVCYSPPPYAPDPVPLPALRNGYVTFGCFNNLAKITPRVIACWSRILRRVPDSRLVLKTHQFAQTTSCDRVREQFAQHGVAPERITLQGASPHRVFLSEYNQIDFVLDPFPYSGGLTTCEALWMGVPTLTLPGDIFASRHSLSHISNAGLSGWDAPDMAQYEDMAVAWAADLPQLATLRQGLRAQVKASPLCDAPRFGRNLGTALRTAWRHWCEDAAPV